MNGKTLVGSLVIGFALPSYALASVSLPTSLFYQNNEKLNQIGTVEVAQRYNFQQVAQRLYNSQDQILGIAYQYSGDQVRWDNILVEFNSQQVKLNLNGKIHKIGKDAGLRVGLYLQPDYQGNFRVIGYDWETGKHCPSWCRNKVEEKLRNFPSEYPRFEAYLRNIL